MESKEIKLTMSQEDAELLVSIIEDQADVIQASFHHFESQGEYSMTIEAVTRMKYLVDKQVREQVDPLHGLTLTQKEVLKTLNSYFLMAEEWEGRQLSVREFHLLKRIAVFVKYGDGDYDDDTKEEQNRWAHEVLTDPHLQDDDEEDDPFGNVGLDDLDLLESVENSGDWKPLENPWEEE